MWESFAPLAKIRLGLKYFCRNKTHLLILSAINYGHKSFTCCEKPTTVEVTASIIFFVNDWQKLNYLFLAYLFRILLYFQLKPEFTRVGHYKVPLRGSGAVFTIIYCLLNLPMGPIASIHYFTLRLHITLHFVWKAYVYTLHYTTFERLVRDKYTSFLGPFISYEENKSLGICHLVSY